MCVFVCIQQGTACWVGAPSGCLAFSHTCQPEVGPWLQEGHQETDGLLHHTWEACEQPVSSHRLFLFNWKPSELLQQCFSRKDALFTPQYVMHQLKILLSLVIPLISGIKTWRLSSLMSTWCLITVKNSMKTIQTLVELVITWGSSLKSAGRSFWNKQTKRQILPVNPFNFSNWSTRFHFVFWWRKRFCRMEGEVRTLNKEPVVCWREMSPWKTKQTKKTKKKSCYMCAGFYYNREKSPKESQKNGVL